MMGFCDYDLNRMDIEANTKNRLRRQDEIFARINELKNPVTILPSNINEMFIHGYHSKLRYIMAFIVAIIVWPVAASVSSMKYKEESFAHYSVCRAVKEQCFEDSHYSLLNEQICMALIISKIKNTNLFNEIG